MIRGIFHAGSGLGNQLHRYVMTRVLALDKGYDFGMINPEIFKGDFLDIDMGKKVPWIPIGDESIYNEKKVINDEGWDVRPYDPDVLEVKDDTTIDGEFQDEKYFEHRLDEIDGWLKLKEGVIPAYKYANTCVINFRGGEYKHVPSLFLPQEYWDKAIAHMKLMNPDMIFEVHTDDEETARLFFPDFTIIHNPQVNWLAIKNASYLILSNSSFAILPALLNKSNKLTVAPKYWAGYNKGYWQLQQNYYKKFFYIHHENL